MHHVIICGTRILLSGADREFGTDKTAYDVSESAGEGNTSANHLLRRLSTSREIWQVSPYHNRGHAMLHSLSIIREVHETARESFADLLYGEVLLTTR